MYNGPWPAFPGSFPLAGAPAPGALPTPGPMQLGQVSAPSAGGGGWQDLLKDPEFLMSMGGHLLGGGQQGQQGQPQMAPPGLLMPQFPILPYAPEPLTALPGLFGGMNAPR